jgi:hypothetical protein
MVHVAYQKSKFLYISERMENFVPIWSLFKGHLAYFVAIRYISWSFGIYFPILVGCNEKNLAVLIWTLFRKYVPSPKWRRQKMYALKVFANLRKRQYIHTTWNGKCHSKSCLQLTCKIVTAIPMFLVFTSLKKIIGPKKFLIVNIFVASWCAVNRCRDFGRKNRLVETKDSVSNSTIYWLPLKS